jgi:hypothetical protein
MYTIMSITNQDLALSATVRKYFGEIIAINYKIMHMTTTRLHRL